MSYPIITFKIKVFFDIRCLSFFCDVWKFSYWDLDTVRLPVSQHQINRYPQNSFITFFLSNILYIQLLTLWISLSLGFPFGLCGDDLWLSILCFQRKWWNFVFIHLYQCIVKFKILWCAKNMYEITKLFSNGFPFCNSGGDIKQQTLTYSKIFMHTYFAIKWPCRRVKIISWKFSV